MAKDTEVQKLSEVRVDAAGAWGERERTLTGEVSQGRRRHRYSLRYLRSSFTTIAMDSDQIDARNRQSDYYVLLILQGLADFQAAGLPAYFKGGTALYKALRTTNRFSEDIDFLQRFGKLKVEATSFTISEPVDTLEVSAMLYDLY